MKHNGYIDSIKEQGYQVVYDPIEVGNCQFAALPHQLHRISIFRSAETLREEIVSYLEKNPSFGGDCLLDYLLEFATWPGGLYSVHGY